MRRATALAVTLAAAAAAVIPAARPAAATAKGIASLDVCGATGCHAVDRAAVHADFGRLVPAPSPDRREPYYTLRAKARISTGKVAEVSSLAWLPRAGVLRQDGQSEWFRPAAPLDRALRHAARGLHPRPAFAPGPITPVTPQARVAEVFAPAAGPDTNKRLGPPAATTTAIAGAAAVLLALAAAASAAGRLWRRSERAPATLGRKAR
jgi:hypothetical protein